MFFKESTATETVVRFKKKKTKTTHKNGTNFFIIIRH